MAFALLELRLAETGERYTDYTISCGADTFPVHKLILHLHSRFFASALSSRWSSGGADKTMDFSEDDPETVRSMVHFFYRFKYAVPASEPVLAFHIKMAVLSDKCECNALLQSAMTDFALHCNGPYEVDAMVGAARLIQKHGGVPSVQYLRKHLLGVMRGRLETLIQSDVFMEMLREMPDWSVDLLRAMNSTQPARADIPSHLVDWPSPARGQRPLRR